MSASSNSSSSSSASKPEPPPENKGEPVTPALLKWMAHMQQEGLIEGGPYLAASSLVKQRNAFGMVKYGQPLMTKDGRDDVEDAMQEMGDLLQYTFKAVLNRRDTRKLREIISVVHLLLYEGLCDKGI